MARSFDPNETQEIDMSGIEALIGTDLVDSDRFTAINSDDIPNDGEDDNIEALIDAEWPADQAA